MSNRSLFNDRSKPRPMKPERPSLARRGRKALIPLLVTGAVFGGALAAARSGAPASDAAPGTPANIDGAQLIDYKEECVGEGCGSEELKEMWSSLQSECVDEVCWTEEVFEISGGPHYQYDPYTRDSYIPQMMDAFRKRLGKRFDDPKMKLGPTDDVWSDIIQFLDGKVITTPKISCDPYCG